MAKFQEIFAMKSLRGLSGGLRINLTENSSIFNENVIMVFYCLAILRKERCKNGKNTLFSNHHGQT